MKVGIIAAKGLFKSLRTKTTVHCGYVILFLFFLKNIEVYPNIMRFACAAVSLLMHKTLNTF